MKFTFGIITGAIAVSTVAFAASALEGPNKSTDEAEHPARSDSREMRGERLGRTSKASDLVGMEVRNYQNEKLGKIEDLAVDLQAGRIVHVIVTTGGFAGIGNTLHAVPPGALHYDSTNKVVHLDSTREKLEAAPKFEMSKWDESSDPDRVTEVYRTYKVEPYFSTNNASAADNTARNVRDRNSGTLTPLDQGNSQADIDTTAQIRKGILAGKNMSVNARNVKVITNKGMVTLRGPVNTAEEKRLIGEIAANASRMEDVDNQLEVK